jgi:hypothetical protein
VDASELPHGLEVQAARLARAHERVLQRLIETNDLDSGREIDMRALPGSRLALVEVKARLRQHEHIVRRGEQLAG